MKLFKVFRRRALDREMDAEMRFHVDMEAAELERMGVPRDEARRRALATFGGIQRYKEEGAESRGGMWLEDLIRDTRYSLRALLRTPGYTAVVILTLALGVAANTSIFSVANGVLFKPLPYREPEKLMVIWDGLEMLGVPQAWVSAQEVVRLRSELKQFEGVAAVRGGSAAIAPVGGGEAQQVQQLTASANFFQILGAGPEIGRGFLPGEDAPGSRRVAVISHKLWTQTFGADRGLIGREILVDGVPTTVVGVLPSHFRYSLQSSLGSATDANDLYTTLLDTLSRVTNRGHYLGVLARARSDVPTPTALAELQALGRRLDDETYGKRGFTFKPVLLQEQVVRDVRPALIALLAAVAMLMVIMCANLAVLALVRTSRREREITVRRAIGASQSRISRQILSETVLLSLAGAGVGSLLGVWALRALLTIAPVGLPRRPDIGIDLTVLGVTLAVALLVGIGMALAPVYHSMRSDISTVLREKAPSRSGGRVRRALVLAQLALCMVLLAGTGLLLGSFVRLMRVDAGFNPEHVMTIELMASRAKYASGRPVVELIQRYSAALRALPGVTDVGATSAPPLSAGADQYGLFFPSSPTNTGVMEKDRLLVDAAPVTPGYFRAMGIDILDGREFDAAQNDSANANVAVIDDQLAKRYFPKGGALGQFLMLDNDSLRVIGIARHVRMYSLQDPSREQMWMPHAFTPYRWMVLAVRTKGDPMALGAAARRAIHTVDAEQPIVNIGRMTDAVSASLAERRLVLTLVGTFAAAALLLAALGVYGVTASSVTQRTRELGIRMALGADRRSVIWSVLSEPTRLVAFGLVIGLAGTFAVGRIVQRLLYGIRPTDPITLASVALVLLAVAVLASYLPARRATKVDPMLSLRAD